MFEQDLVMKQLNVFLNLPYHDRFISIYMPDPSARNFIIHNIVLCLFLKLINHQVKLL